MSLAEQEHPVEPCRPEPSGGKEMHLAPEEDTLRNGENAFLTRLLIEQAVLPRSAIARATDMARESGERLETVLTRLGLIPAKDLAEMLACALNLPVVSAKDFPGVPVLEGALNRRFLWDARLIPLKEDGDTVTVAMVHPLDTYAAEAMRFACGNRVQRAVVCPADFEAAFARLYGEMPPGAHGTAALPENTSKAPVFAIRRWYSRAESVRAVAASWFSTMRTALSQSPKPVRRAISLGLVAAVHLFGLWLVADTVLPVARSPGREIGLALSSMPAPVPRESLPPPDLETPALVEIPAPDIEIVSAPQTNTVALAAGEAETIAPRPDPAHVNDPPDTGGAAAHCATETVLKILVLADGTIGDAAIVKSCGAAELDALALSFAKTHWHYLPATLAGQAIDAWTTVIVPLQ